MTQGDMGVTVGGPKHDLTRLNHQPAESVSTTEAHCYHQDVLRHPEKKSVLVSPPGFKDPVRYESKGYQMKMLVISDEHKCKLTSRPFQVSCVSDIDEPELSEFQRAQMQTIIQGAGTWMVLILRNTNSRRLHRVGSGGGNGARYSWVESATFNGVDRSDTLDWSEIQKRVESSFGAESVSYF